MPMNSGDKEGSADVREQLDRLEEVKDLITAFLEGAPVPDPATRAMWIGDAKDAFFEVVAAYDLLSSDREGPEADRSSSSLAFLEMARSRVRQVSSELKTFKTDVAEDLIMRLENAFEGAAGAVSGRAKATSSGRGPSEEFTAVTKLGEDNFALRCACCGKVAAVFRVEVPRLSTTGEEAILFEGITKSTHLDMSNEKAVFEKLEDGDIRGLSEFFEKMMQGGLDAYCPTCDKVYCREHYDAEEEWDEGFYDCTYGTCPAGHRRLIDD